MALHGDWLLVGTSDMHVVALEAKNGSVVWDQRYRGLKETGWQLTGGPLGGEEQSHHRHRRPAPGGNSIVALDLRDRQRSLAIPLDRAAGRARGRYLEWSAGRQAQWRLGLDSGKLRSCAEPGLFRTGQTYDTGPLLHSVNQPGITNDGLYTDTTLAFNPETGKLVWHFQHMPNDQWDLDWAFERQIVDVPVNGANRKLVLTSGKEAFYDALDAATGQYVFSIDMGLQNVIASVDPKTGAKHINPQIIPGDGETKTVCPHAGGAKTGFRPRTTPATRMLYVPLVESCMDLIPVKEGERGGLSIGRAVHHPAEARRRWQLWTGRGGEFGDAKDRLDQPAACAADQRDLGHSRRRGVRRGARPLCEGV